jgi:uncharacterized protein YgbK (DUF1537 family)
VVEALQLGVRAVVVDAASDAELDRIVLEAHRWGRPLLWVGSAGLVAALARSLPTKSLAERRAAVSGPMIFCVGSDHKVTVAQEEALFASQHTMRMSLGGEAAPLISHAVLHVPRGCNPARLCEALARNPLAPLLLSGGDTASLVMRALGAQSIDLLDEVMPGVPRGILRGGDFDGRTVLTKSGGFGRPDALIRIADFFPYGSS